MKIHRSIHALIMFDTVAWCAWCPELDVMTQGDTPENAAAMLEEACRMVVEDAVTDMRPDPFIPGEVLRKRVVHPLRLGATAIEDESWETFQKALRLTSYGGNGDSYSLDELADGLDPVILANGSLEVTTRTGVSKVNITIDDWGWVPCEKFKVEYEQRFERSTTFTVRSSVIRYSSKNGEEEGVIMAEAKIFARDPAGEIKVSKYVPQS